MTDTTPPYPDIDPPGPSVWRNLSVIWLVPVVALAAALLIAWQAYSDRGGLIEITFANAAGISAGETTIRYRDVVIGEVEDVSFTDDLAAVRISARVNAQVLPYLDDDAAFWVVRPEITSQGVTGLSTVVSGVYIEGAWDGQAEVAQRAFRGLRKPLFIRPGEAGQLVTLRLDPDMQVQAGTPLFYRGLAAGRLEAPRLLDDGETLEVNAFVEAPFDAYLSDATRFWDASGFSLDIGAQGVSLNVDNLASLVAGGLEFDAVYSDGLPIEQGHQFQIYESEDAARASAFAVFVEGEIPVEIEFDRFTRGLRVGMGVHYRGEQVGNVSEVSIRSLPSTNG
ncbi:MAG: MlaD family protein, partial [Pseudomonadota bacterium]